MQSNLQVIFCRHQFKNRPRLLEELWKKRWIALDFGGDSLDPYDYPKGNARNALLRFQKYCKRGAIVAADYRLIRSGGMLLGRIPPDSRYKLWKYKERGESKARTYKIVRLKEVREVSFALHHLLAAIQPQQGTIMRWKKAKNYVSAIFQGQSLPWKVESLSPGQLEVACYEYLRASGIVDALLLPIGRSLVHVDIVAADRRGRTVFAQVTHAKKDKTINAKIEKLQSYTDGPQARVFLFGPANALKAKKCPGIRFVSIESVFEKLARNRKSMCYMMLKKMLDPSEWASGRDRTSRPIPV